MSKVISALFAFLALSGCGVVPTPVICDSADAYTKDELVEKWSEHSYYGASFTPKEIGRWDIVDENVRLKVDAHLKKRLGKFYKNIKFVSGQYVDKKVLLKQDPGAADYQWEVPAYTFDFVFKDAFAGIKSYIAQIKVREDGSIIEEIDLPCFSCDENKLVFQPISKVRTAAASVGFSSGCSSEELGYDEESDSIGWFYKKAVTDDGLTRNYKTVWVSAHTGLVVSEGAGWSIR